MIKVKSKFCCHKYLKEMRQAKKKIQLILNRKNKSKIYLKIMIIRN